MTPLSSVCHDGGEYTNPKDPMTVTSNALVDDEPNDEPPPARPGDHTEMLAANGYQFLAAQLHQPAGQIGSMPIEAVDVVIATTARQIREVRAAGGDPTALELNLRVEKAARRLNREMAKIQQSAETRQRITGPAGGAR